MTKSNIFVIVVLIALFGVIGIWGFGGDDASAPVVETPAMEAPLGGTDANNTDGEVVFCTMEAKLCPDGSYVGRTGPMCEFAACPGEVGEAENAVKEFVITGENFAFSPSTITVNEGDRVRITFENTGGFHDFVIDEYDVATPQAQGPDTQVVEFVADEAGSFEYYCSVGSHRAMGMFGTLRVVSSE